MSENSRRLREIANRQGGYFTTRQAAAVGFHPQNASYYLSTGEWVRAAHGIYRLAGVPSSDVAKEELNLWLLWTIGRKAEEPRGALAYETSLTVFNLSDLIPSKVHITVPRNFKVSKIPKALVLHYADRPSGDIIDYEGYRVIRPIVTILDLLREGRVSPEHIERAFKGGVRKGFIPLHEIDRAEVKPSESKLIKAWMKEGYD